MGTASHWNNVYSTKAADAVSWFEASPAMSIRLIRCAMRPGHRVVDVGAGASTLADVLIADGYEVTALDVSDAALDLVRGRVGEKANYAVADVLTWSPAGMFDVWHDRAVFHFLTDRVDQLRYAELARDTVTVGGALVIGTFAPYGPSACSGLSTVGYDGDSLAALFSDGFILEHSEREEHHTPWGAVQHFTWAVLRRQV